MTIPSGKGRNGDLSIAIILLKSGSTLLASFPGVYHRASIKAVSRQSSPNARENRSSRPLKRGNRTVTNTCSREGKTRGRMVVERMNIKSFFDFPEE